MSKKKKNLADEILDLKLSESEEMSLDSAALEIDLEDGDSDEEAASKNSTKVSSQEADHDGQTLRLVQTQSKNQDLATLQSPHKAEQEDIRVSYGLPANKQAPRSDLEGDVEASPQLKNSEHLRIAQRKINDLEEEALRLRRENEELAAAGMTFKKLNDEYYSEIETLKGKLEEQRQTSSQEIKILKKISQNKDKQAKEYKQEIDELKSRIENNFQRVRMREKDLEHRLEIAKMEEVAVIKSKDQLILKLKRQIDEISNESVNFRTKSQENYQELQKKQQVVRGAVRALRIALIKLEGDDATGFDQESDQEGDE